MILISGIPMPASGAIHHVVKGGQGPRASAVTWQYVPPDYGCWYGHIVNSGLKSLVVDVDDITNGAPVSIMHQRIRFAAYPTNIVDTTKAIMAKDRLYQITATPNGPEGTFCDIVEPFTVFHPPVASFTIIAIDAFTVIVDGSASYDPDGTVVAWTWDFGDGTTGLGVAMSHTYAATGLYAVTLTVMDNDGLTGSVTQNAPHPPGLPPFAAFNLVYDTTEFRGEVRADAYDSYDPDGTIVQYDWTFGDRAGSSGVRAIHTYAAPGTYTITMTVTDNDGLTTSAQRTVIISDMPAATFEHHGGFGLEVTVDASGSYTNPGGTILSYDWDFGDGGTGSGVVASHKYLFVGEYSYYTICLTVTDSDGLKAMACKIVGVVDYHPSPSYTYLVDVFTVSVDGSMSWDDTGIVSYAWSWGDGTFGTGITASHTYALPGTYTIGLTVTDENGQTSEATREVLVPPLPIPSFTYTVSGSTVCVDASGSSGYGGIVSYTWDWGDGSASETYAAPIATHEYSSPLSAPSSFAAPSGWYPLQIDEPDSIFGWTFLMDGTPLPDCIVKVTNPRSGETVTTVSDADGVYSTSLYSDRAGDIIEVTAVKGDFFGTNSGILEYAGLWYLQLDVYLAEGHLITLTVTDTLGRTSTMTQFVVGV